MFPDSIYSELLAAVSHVGADIDTDCEHFLSEMYASHASTDLDFIKFVRANVDRWFRTTGTYPEWIQNAEWQYHKGRPMIFVGEIAIPREAGLYHDDARVYVFVSEDGVIKGVIQVV